VELLQFEDDLLIVVHAACLVSRGSVGAALCGKRKNDSGFASSGTGRHVFILEGLINSPKFN